MATLIPTDIPFPDAPHRRAEGPDCPIENKPSDTYRRSQGRAAVSEASGEVAPRHRATGLIDAKERQHLGRLGREAWVKCGAKGAGIDCDEWRHEQVAEASDGKATCLHDLKRGQYKDVLRHFLQIAGHSARAFRVAQKSGQGHADRDLAMEKLKEACESGDLAFPEYPESICRRQFKVGLDELETGKVWFLFYTCTNRARTKNKKASEIASEGVSDESAVPTLETGCDAENPTGGPGEKQV